VNVSKKAGEVWKLFDETAFALNRTALAERYARPLATLRARLESAFAGAAAGAGAVNSAILKEVQDALVELRRQLRLAGYDLSLAKFNLVFDGFHNDDVWGTFTRMTLFIDRSGAFYWHTGDDNHVTQASFLNRRLAKIPGYDIAQRHYLWFLWSRTSLTLSGSATEGREDYERLTAYAESDPLLFLSRLKGLR
jgi:hypothetical protein